MESLGNIGKYQLLKKLAVGGMAEIYLASQSGPEGFSKLVVIKRILPHLAAQERFVQMFLDEARMAARFNHPNIVQIFDLGREEDSFFIAMEYIPGEDIKAIVRRCAKVRRRIPLEHTVKIFSGVLDGLHFAHNQNNLDGQSTGVVHRDVSPHNIIVSFQGGVKLLDFGIAKARTQISTTVPGRVKGKHAYMSPEQVRGQDLDGRSDVFAAGIVMYELLTWSRLFKRKKHIDTLRAVTEAEIRPLRALNPEIDAELERIVLKSLARDRDQRYETAQQMQIELEDYLLQRGLRSNQVLLGQFVSELYSEKLLAREKALTEAQAVDLEGAVLAASEKGPDLVAFLDMFFADSSSSQSGGTADELDEVSAPEFTPSGDYTPASLVEREGRPGLTEIPARATGQFLTRNPPPPRAPEGMAAKHVRPHEAGEDETAPRLASAPPGDMLGLDDLGGAAGPPLDDIIDPDAYAEQLDPLGTSSKGKGIWVVLFLLLLIGGGVALFMYKDELSTVEAPSHGLFQIKSIPGGADVILDGVQQQARTPMEIDDIEPNREYQIEVSLPDLPKWTKKVVLTDTTKPLIVEAVLSKSEAEKVRMSGKPIIAGVEGEGLGAIAVASEPSGGLVYLDGVSTGKKTPTTLKAVAAGLDHVILVEAEGKAPAYERIHLEAGGSAQVQVALTEEEEPLGGRVGVRIESEPEGARVSINGYPMKKPTPMAASLLLGRQSDIELELNGKKKALQVRPVPSVDLTIFVKIK